MNWVEISLVALGGIALIVEIIVLFTEKGGMLISAQIRHNALRWTFWPLLWGVLGGHFFGPVLPWRQRWMPIIVIFFGVIALIRDVFVRKHVPKWLLFPIFLFGVALGALFWSQS